MNTILIILAIIAAPFVGVVLYAVGYAGYLIISGKEKSPEIQALIAEKKAAKKSVKKESNRKSSTHWLSYPSPLNNWGLWH
jgi:hypothetical protein